MSLTCQDHNVFVLSTLTLSMAKTNGLMNEAPGFRRGQENSLLLLVVGKARDLSAKPEVNCETLAGKSCLFKC